MPLTRGDYERLAHQRLEVHRALERLSRTHADGEIERFIPNLRQQRGAYPLHDPYPRHRVPAPELRHCIGNDQRSRLRPDAERDAAHASALEYGQVVGCLAQLALDHARPGEKCLPRWGGACTARGALQELDLKLGLELLDAFRDRRLRDADAAGRTAQAARLNDGDEIADLLDAH